MCGRGVRLSFCSVSLEDVLIVSWKVVWDVVVVDGVALIERGMLVLRSSWCVVVRGVGVEEDDVEMDD